jgi:hypothetical protein
MCGTVLCLATVALGAEVGWRPLPEGGMEYIIQIEPHMLEAMKAGDDIFSDIPPNVRGVRSYRITVGTGEVPRIGELRAEPEPEKPAPGPDTSLDSQPSEPDGSGSDSPTIDAPNTLHLPDNAQSLGEYREKPALFEQDIPESGPSAAPEGVQEPPPEPAKPWPLLTLALAFSFGTSGGMLYLGWIAWGYRRRYRALLQRTAKPGREADAIGQPAESASP